MPPQTEALTEGNGENANVDHVIEGVVVVLFDRRHPREREAAPFFVAQIDEFLNGPLGFSKVDLSRRVDAHQRVADEIERLLIRVHGAVPPIRGSSLVVRNRHLLPKVEELDAGDAALGERPVEDVDHGERAPSRLVIHIGNPVARHHLEELAQSL